MSLPRREGPVQADRWRDLGIEGSSEKTEVLLLQALPDASTGWSLMARCLHQENLAGFERLAQHAQNRWGLVPATVAISVVDKVLEGQPGYLIALLRHGGAQMDMAPLELTHTVRHQCWYRVLANRCFKTQSGWRGLVDFIERYPSGGGGGFGGDIASLKSENASGSMKADVRDALKEVENRARIQREWVALWDKGETPDPPFIDSWKIQRNPLWRFLKTTADGLENEECHIEHVLQHAQKRVSLMLSRGADPQVFYEKEPIMAVMGEMESSLRRVDPAKVPLLYPLFDTLASHFDMRLCGQDVNGMAWWDRFGFNLPLLMGSLGAPALAQRSIQCGADGNKMDRQGRSWQWYALTQGCLDVADCPREQLKFPSEEGCSLLKAALRSRLSPPRCGPEDYWVAAAAERAYDCACAGEDIAQALPEMEVHGVLGVPLEEKERAQARFEQMMSRVAALQLHASTGAVVHWGPSRRF